MKLITFNTWGGRVHKPLLEFFAQHADVDIFCLQEIYHGAKARDLTEKWTNDAFNLYSDTQAILTNHNGYFRPSVGNWYGLAMFVKKDITVEKEGEILIHDVPGYLPHKSDGNHPRNMQYVQIVKDRGSITVANVHGFWNGKGKTDTSERLAQSRKIKEFLDSCDGSKILCGDFNLLPDTESLKIVAQGMRDLVKDFGVTSTRTSLYTKPERFADYIFTSPDIAVNDFKVLPHEVSDHSPLLVDFE